MPEKQTDAWAKLQAPFGPDDIELLPRYTGKEKDKSKREKRKCAECGGYHEFPCIHLSYVGHAGITMRLNEVDPAWTWEPMARDERGMPVLDHHGGLWAWMTVLGVRKPAYGDPGKDWSGKPKNSPDGMKEAIGDMIRNGAMRYGCGTQLWSKSDRAKNDLIRAGMDDDDDASAKPTPKAEVKGQGSTEAQQKKIHIEAHEAGIDDASLKAMLKKRFGVESTKDLTKAQASQVIEGLQKARADKSTEELDAKMADLGATEVTDEEVPF